MITETLRRQGSVYIKLTLLHRTIFIKGKIDSMVRTWTIHRKEVRNNFLERPKYFSLQNDSLPSLGNLSSQTDPSSPTIPLALKASGQRCGSHLDESYMEFQTPPLSGNKGSYAVSFIIKIHQLGTYRLRFESSLPLQFLQSPSLCLGGLY